MASKKYMLDVIIGGKTSSSYFSSLNSASGALEGFQRTTKRVVGAVATAFASMGIKETLEDFVDAYKDFEKSAANTSAIFSATAQERIKLEEAAVNASKETLTSSTEAADALSYMALAGWDVNESIAALVPMLKLAEATGEGTKETTDLVTDSMSALGIEADELSVYLDKLAAVNNNANTTANMAMESLLKSGGAMRSLMSTPEELSEGMDDLITAVGILGNNGTKAAEAGTVLNSVLTRIATNSNAQKALQSLGMSAFDEEGKFIGIENFLRMLKGSMDDLTVEQRVEILGSEAGSRMYSRFQYLLDAVSSGTEDAGDTWNELEEKIVSSQGSLEEFHAKATDTLSAAQQYAENAKENMMITASDIFSDDLKELTLWYGDKIYEISGVLNDFLEDHEKDIVRFGEDAYKVFSGLWEDAIKPAGEFILNNSGAISGGLLAMFGVSTAGKIAGGATRIIGVLKSMNPYVLAAAGAVTVIGAAVGAYNDHINALKTEDLAERFDGVSLSMKEIKDIARDIVAGGDVEKLTEVLNAAGDSESAWENIKDAVSEVNKAEFKLEVKRDEANSESYAGAVNDFLEDVQKYIDEGTWSLTVSADFLLGDNEDFSTLSTETNRKITEQVSALVEETKLKITQGLSDGILSEGEVSYIASQYIERLRQVTDAVNEAQMKARYQSLAWETSGSTLDHDSFEALVARIGEENVKDQEIVTQSLQNTLAQIELNRQYGGYATDQAYQDAVNEAMEAAEKKKAEYTVNGLEEYMKQMKLAYSDVFEYLGGEEYAADINKIIEGSFGKELIYNNATGWENDPTQSGIGFSDLLSQAAQKATDSISRMNLLEDLKLVRDQINELKELYAGQDMPEEISNMLDTYNSLLAVTGDRTEDASRALKAISESEKALEMIKEYDLTDEVDQAFGTLAKQDYSRFTDAMASEFDSDLDRSFSPGFDVSADVRVNISGTVTGKEKLIKDLNEERDLLLGLNRFNVAHNAMGNIVTHPTLTTFAEDGPEAAIPINRTNRSRRLWIRTGELLGMNEDTGSAPINVTYTSNINISGNADKETVREGARNGYEDFVKYFKKMVREQARVQMR